MYHQRLEDFLKISDIFCSARHGSTRGEDLKRCASFLEGLKYSTSSYNPNQRPTYRYIWGSVGGVDPVSDRFEESANVFLQIPSTSLYWILNPVIKSHWTTSILKTTEGFGSNNCSLSKSIPNHLMNFILQITLFKKNYPSMYLPELRIFIFSTILSGPHNLRFGMFFSHTGQ